MQINNLTSGSLGNSGSALGSSRTYSTQQQQSFKSLLADVQSGNMSAAQQDYASLTQGGTPPANSMLGQIGLALGSNNISAAQQIVNKIQAQVSGTGSSSAAHAHHHHHHGGASTPDLNSLLANSGATSTSGIASTTGSQLNTTA